MAATYKYIRKLQIYIYNIIFNFNLVQFKFIYSRAGQYDFESISLLFQMFSSIMKMMDYVGACVPKCAETTDMALFFEA